MQSATIFDGLSYYLCHMKKFVDVIVPLPVAGLFTYSVPEELTEKVQWGNRVIVPFGAKKYYTGIVVQTDSTPSATYEVKEVAEEQLCELGLELKSFTIKGIGDQNGYFEALSKPQIAAVKRDAEIAQAEAVKESMIKTSEARRAGEQARLEAEARMAEAKKEADIKKLNFEKERQTTQAISDAAYSIQQNVTQKDITNTEMDASVLKEQRAREVREAAIQIEIAAEQKNIPIR